MQTKLSQPYSSLVTAVALCPVLALFTSTLGRAADAAGAGGGGPPRIIATSPKSGDTEVNPNLAEITVTFDRDMAGGFSWTGGGPEFPQSPEGQKAHWRDKRTCVFPVRLESGRSYRVGINSPSFRNFRSVDGTPATPSEIRFTTTGASDDAKNRSAKPRIVKLVPLNGAKDVDPGLTELRVTFSVPMSGGCSWTGGGPQFPTIPEGKKPYWTEDKKTCVLPVSLQPAWEYRLGLNSVSFKNFRSASGVPLDPVGYSFKTRQ
ncbi:MAG TPA: Ig-like domain-containing protein [Verrucomicrobiae bacterium]